MNKAALLLALLGLPSAAASSVDEPLLWLSPSDASDLLWSARNFTCRTGGLLAVQGAVGGDPASEEELELRLRGQEDLWESLAKSSSDRKAPWHLTAPGRALLWGLCGCGAFGLLPLLPPLLDAAEDVWFYRLLPFLEAVGQQLQDEVDALETRCAELVEPVVTSGQNWLQKQRPKKREPFLHLQAPTIDEAQWHGIFFALASVVLGAGSLWCLGASQQGRHARAGWAGGPQVVPAHRPDMVEARLRRFGTEGGRRLDHPV